MARHESDREDLMREATALVRRVELALPGRPEHVVCGFHSDGRLSIYFGPDPVYHFDTAGRLRRAYVDGCLYRTQGTTLARLKRVRTPAATELQRHDLSPDELPDFLECLRARLSSLEDALTSGTAGVVQCVPPNDAELLRDVHQIVSKTLCAGPDLAPSIKGKR